MKLEQKALSHARHFLRAAVAKDIDEAINSAGGALVPAAMEDAIIVRRNRAGVFRRNARLVRMGSDAQSTPRRTSDVVASFVSEGQPLPQSDNAYDAIKCVAKKMAILTRRSSELEEDAVDADAEDLINSISYAFALAEDKIGFTGDGSSSSGGTRGLTTVLTDGAHGASTYTATGHTVFSAITASDIAETIGLLPDWATQNAKFYISAYGFASCFARLGATGGLNIGPDGNVQRNLMFLGFPCELTSQLPGNVTLTGKAAILFGDLSLSSTLGDRRGLMIKTLRERFAELDQVAFACTSRLDVVNHDLGDATNAGGCVALIGG